MKLTLESVEIEPTLQIHLESITDTWVTVKVKTPTNDWHVLSLKVSNGKLICQKVAEIADPLVSTDDYGQITERLNPIDPPYEIKVKEPLT